MFSVFICYGGKEGELIGECLREFLSNAGLNPFLASPKAQNMISGQKLEDIDQKLLESPVVTAIITDEFKGSKGEKEIKDLFKLGYHNRIVSFAVCDHVIPEYMNNIWRPIHFTPERPEESFCRLLNEVLKLYIFNKIRPKIGREGEIIELGIV